MCMSVGSPPRAFVASNPPSHISHQWPGTLQVGVGLTVASSVWEHGLACTDLQQSQPRSAQVCTCTVTLVSICCNCLLTLALTIFPPHTLGESLSLRTRIVMDLTHLWPSTPQSLFLCMLASLDLCVIHHPRQKQLLW